MQTKQEQKTNISEAQTKRAFWISLGTGIVMLVVLAVFIVTSNKAVTGPKDVRILIALVSLCSFISAWLSRQGKAIVGISILLLVFYAVVVVTALSLDNVGVAIAAVTVVFTYGITSQVIPFTRLARYANTFALVMAAGIILLDIIQPYKRLPNTTPGVTWGLAIFLVLGYGVLAFQQLGATSLRAKLIIAFLIVTIIPLAIISLITYYSSDTALINDANQKLKSAAETTAADIDQFISSTLEHARAVGQFPAVVDYFTLPAWQRAGSPEEERAVKLITALAREDPVFISSVALYDTKGITQLDTVVADIGSDKSSRNYFQETMRTQLPYVSEVEHSATSGVPSLYFAAPVHDVTGKVIGILRIRYNATILQKMIIAETGLVGETSYAVLLESNHIRLAHGKNRDRVYHSIVPLDPAVAADLQAKGFMPLGTPEENATNLVDFEAGLNNIQQQPYFASDTDGDGALEQATLAPLKNKNWTAVFIQDQDVFLAPIVTQTRNNLLVAVLVTVAVGVAGFVFAQTLAGPVARLTQVAEAIAGGDINIQAKVETSDEIGRLAGTFNRMTQQLRDFIVSLEERVAARTKDLATVAEVGTATATILETAPLLKAVVELTKERFNLYHSHIYLLDEKGENLVLAEGAGEPGRQMKARRLSIPLAREQSLVARAARERKGVTVNDVTQAPDFLPNPLLPNTRSELAVPLITGGKVIGVFDIQSDVVGRFAESDINIQNTLAAQVATSIQNVRSFEQSKAQADFETLVNAISQKIQHATSMDETLQTAVRELGTALGATRVSANIQARQDANENKN